MSPKVSILVPTRGRPQDFLEMQQSVTERRDVEILAALDADDSCLVRYAFAANTTEFVGERDWLTRRWNRLARLASGEYLVLGNDDMRFYGPEWVDLLGQYPSDKALVIGFQAGSHTDDHFEFPILTRKAYEVQGFFVPEQTQGLFADTWLYDVGKKADRLRYISEYHIRHLHWSLKTRDRDGTDDDKTMRGRGSARGFYRDSEKQREDIARRFREN